MTTSLLPGVAAQAACTITAAAGAVGKGRVPLAAVPRGGGNGVACWPLQTQRTLCTAVHTAPSPLQHPTTSALSTPAPAPVIRAALIPHALRQVRGEEPPLVADTVPPRRLHKHTVLLLAPLALGLRAGVGRGGVSGWRISFRHGGTGRAEGKNGEQEAAEDHTPSNHHHKHINRLPPPPPPAARAVRRGGRKRHSGSCGAGCGQRRGRRSSRGP